MHASAAIRGLCRRRDVRSALCIRPDPAQYRRHLEGQGPGGFVGPTPYRVSEGTGPNFGGEIEYSYVVKQQQGARFSGDQSAGKVTETIIGALRPPEFRSGIIIDHDGESDFTLRNATTMDVCYRHINLTSKVVACFTLEKQP